MQDEKRFAAHAHTSGSVQFTLIPSVAVRFPDAMYSRLGQGLSFGCAEPIGLSRWVTNMMAALKPFPSCL